MEAISFVVKGSGNMRIMFETVDDDGIIRRECYYSFELTDEWKYHHTSEDYFWYNYEAKLGDWIDNERKVTRISFETDPNFQDTTVSFWIDEIYFEGIMYGAGIFGDYYH